jgi:hypothetical protein
METGNVDVVLMRIPLTSATPRRRTSRGGHKSEATSTAHLNRLSRQARRPDAAGKAPRRIVANVFAGPWGEPAAAYQ